MIRFKAEDGYSYIIDIKSRHPKSFRIDSEEIQINLGTNESMEIHRLDISPEVSRKLRDIRL